MAASPLHSLPTRERDPLHLDPVLTVSQAECWLDRLFSDFNSAFESVTPVPLDAKSAQGYSSQLEVLCRRAGALEHATAMLCFYLPGDVLIRVIASIAAAHYQRRIFRSVADCEVDPCIILSPTLVSSMARYLHQTHAYLWNVDGWQRAKTGIYTALKDVGQASQMLMRNSLESFSESHGMSLQDLTLPAPMASSSSDATLTCPTPTEEISSFLDNIVPDGFKQSWTVRDADARLRHSHLDPLSAQPNLPYLPPSCYACGSHDSDSSSTCSSTESCTAYSGSPDPPSPTWSDFKKDLPAIICRSPSPPKHAMDLGVPSTPPFSSAHLMIPVSPRSKPRPTPNHLSLEPTTPSRPHPKISRKKRPRSNSSDGIEPVELRSTKTRRLSWDLLLRDQTGEVVYHASSGSFTGGLTPDAPSRHASPKPSKSKPKRAQRAAAPTSLPTPPPLARAASPSPLPSRSRSPSPQPPYLSSRPLAHAPVVAPLQPRTLTRSHSEPLATPSRLTSLLAPKPKLEPHRMPPPPSRPRKGKGRADRGVSVIALSPTSDRAPDLKPRPRSPDLCDWDDLLALSAHGTTPCPADAPFTARGPPVSGGKPSRGDGPRRRKRGCLAGLLHSVWILLGDRGFALA
ncbi:uncharacterized protein BXZ73DRAFT_103464 [Epithele typhae]|uniref:uncharacterized protein n=1 Tax=Epithele typhae TaxID=378194 RepID=UPI0020073A31|nr:uncharacterized protein BXZ73DRAFT_103464 [Epithele typhae]KAH9924624.1 hypothetical protein BXZ73DRAFT_103464 [Epithele typhae]